MDFITYLTIAYKMIAASILVLAYFVLLALSIIPPLASFVVWDTNDKFKNQNWLLRFAFLFITGPLGITLCFYVMPYLLMALKYLISK